MVAMVEIIFILFIGFIYITLLIGIPNYYFFCKKEMSLKYIFISIPISLFLVWVLLSSILITYFPSKAPNISYNTPNIFINEFWDIISAPLIALVVGFVITKRDNQKSIEIQNLNRIDEASGWRKELMNVASHKIINKADIYRIRASLRYESKDKDINYKELTTAYNKIDKENAFEVMTSVMISYCDYLTDIAPSKISKTNNQRKLRIYTRYLLKHHWEYFINYPNSTEKKEQNKIEKAEVDLAKDTIKLILEVDGKKLKKKTKD